MKLTKIKLKQMIREEIQKSSLDEADLEKVAIPGQIKRFMRKFIDSLKDARLTRRRQLSILFRIIKALGIDERELVMYMSRVKRGMKD